MIIVGTITLLLLAVVSLIRLATVATTACYAGCGYYSNDSCGGAMEGNLDTRFNYRSGRATEARFYAKYGKVVLIGCAAMMALISLLGVVLLLSGQGLGWLILSIGMWFAVPVLWVRLRLKVLPASRQPRSINDILSGEVLGLLPERRNTS